MKKTYYHENNRTLLSFLQVGKYNDTRAPKRHWARSPCLAGSLLLKPFVSGREHKNISSQYVHPMPIPRLQRASHHLDGSALFGRRLLARGDLDFQYSPQACANMKPKVKAASSNSIAEILCLESRISANGFPRMDLTDRTYPS